MMKFLLDFYLSSFKNIRMMAYSVTSGG